MKKYVLTLVLIAILMSMLFLISARRVEIINNKNFENSGYILKYTDSQEKYYFKEKTSYKDTYNNQIVFKNTDGEKISLNKYNYIHYDNGSISSFTNGVLVELNDIDSDPITYYNISSGKILKKLGNSYVTKNLNNDMDFSNFIWKISGNKYLIAGSDIKIVFSDGTIRLVDDYMEIEYIENEIVKIYNNEEIYETISSDVFLQIGENIKLNLGNKCIYKDNEIKMTLENMIIDSNDNVNIIDIEELKQSEKEENEKVEENENENVIENTTIVNTQSGAASATSGGDTINNGGIATISAQNDNVDDDSQITLGENDAPQIVETEIDDSLYVTTPKYIINTFEASSTGLKTKVEIVDPEDRLIPSTFISILNNDTGKVIELPESNKKLIEIDINSLEPDTTYTLRMEAAYTIEKDEYRKYFVYKTFRTKALGITLEKDLFTPNSLAFNLNFDPDSTVSKIDVKLEESEKPAETLNNAKETEFLAYTDLIPDTEYTLRIDNIFIGNTTNSNYYEYKFRTLKNKPKLVDGTTHGNIKVDMDKWNGNITLAIPKVEENNNIELYRYQVYTQTEGQETVVVTKTTTEPSITLEVDDSTILRNVNYYARVFATFYDNEKLVEYEIANTETSFNMNTSKMPTVRFEPEVDSTGRETGVTFNSIKGKIIIEDTGKTIDPKNANIEIIYSSTTKGINDSGTKKFANINNDLEIPFQIDELKSNETYNVSIYANYDLHDGNDIRYGYIGSISITTKEPVPMQAVWRAGTQGIDINLKLDSTQDSIKEAESLYSFKLSLYLGQEGASHEPIAVTYITDNGRENFEQTIKNDYYDKDGLIKQSTFGISDGDMEKIMRENRYCTIVLSDAKDYVSKNTDKNFENVIPIIDNVKTYQIKSIIDRNPSSPEDAIKLTQVLKSKLQTVTYDKIISTHDYNTIEEIINNNNISNSTVSAYRVYANISTLQLENYNYFEYFIYDKNNTLIAESGLLEKNVENNTAPISLFLLSNGTSNEIEKDTYLARGNEYYFKYYAYVNELKEGKYPVEEEQGDFWSINGLLKNTVKKQEPIVIMYPSSNDYDSMSYKYKINDVDNSIKVENGKRYFKYFFQGRDLSSINKKEAIIGNNSVNDGFWTVKFDTLSEFEFNYSLDTKLMYNLIKGAEFENLDLISQKRKKIIEQDDFITELYYNNEQESQKLIKLEDINGISKIISFNNLLVDQKDLIESIEIELIDKDNLINPIIQNYSATTLANNDWKIVLNYLDLIKNYSEYNFKNKVFDINVKINFATNKAGFDYQFEKLSYQQMNNTYWLLLSTNQNFSGPYLRPQQNNNNTFSFESDKVVIKRNGEAIGWLNYSEHGLTRDVGTNENVAIIPVKIDTKEIENLGELSFSGVLPGIDSKNDLKIEAGPTDVSIAIKKLYNSGTINSNENYIVNADIYKEKTNELVEILENIDSDGAKLENLEKNTNYYFKLYILINNVKYYLCDISDSNNISNEKKYTFQTLSEVVINNISVNFDKLSKEKGLITIISSSNVNNGFKCFKYEICDKLGNLINYPILYSVDGINYNSIDNGSFYVNLNEFDALAANFGVVYLNSDRNTFFEYNETYIFKITPYIVNTDGELETIGTTATTSYKFNPPEPEVSLYAKRVKGLEEENSYIEWSISISDSAYRIANEKVRYKIFKNGNEEPFLDQEINYTNYFTIRVNATTNNIPTSILEAYRLEVYYEFYNGNRTDETTTSVETKSLNSVENGISIGSLSWEIENNSLIKIKFYDSYELENIHSLKCTIYDTDRRILKVVPATEISIVDNTNNLNDPHKSITYSPIYTFEKSKSYIVSVKFLDIEGKEIAASETISPITNY